MQWGTSAGAGFQFKLIRSGPGAGPKLWFLALKSPLQIWA